MAAKRQTGRLMKARLGLTIAGGFTGAWVGIVFLGVVSVAVDIFGTRPYWWDTAGLLIWGAAIGWGAACGFYWEAIDPASRRGQGSQRA